MEKYQEKKSRVLIFISQNKIVEQIIELNQLDALKLIQKGKTC